MKKLLIGIVMALLLLYLYCFVDISHLRGVELLGSWPSPDGRYTVNAWLTNGGATTAYGVLCEAVRDRNHWNIYWQYDETEAEVAWLDDRTVRINGVELDVVHGRYDWRKQ